MQKYNFLFICIFFLFFCEAQSQTVPFLKNSLTEQTSEQDKFRMGAGWTNADYDSLVTDWVLVSFRTNIAKSTEVIIMPMERAKYVHTLISTL